MAEPSPEAERPKKPRRGNGPPPKRSDEEIEKALRASKGVCQKAARLLKIDDWTLRRRINKSTHLQELLAELRENILDEAQFRLENLLSKPGHKDHAKIVMFTLRTLGRKRGFVERHELTGTAPTDPTGSPLKVQFFLPEREDD